MGSEDSLHGKAIDLIWGIKQTYDDLTLNNCFFLLLFSRKF